MSTASSINNGSVDKTAAAPRKRGLSQWQTLLFGQALALIACAVNASGFSLAYQYGVRTQFFQLFWTYLILSFHLLLRSDIKASEEGFAVLGISTIRLRLPLWKYLVMAVMHVLPNVLVLLSFKYTSLSNSILLGSLCVPSVMFFSRLLLKTRFCRNQYLGVLLCVLGGALIVYSDAVADTMHAPQVMEAVNLPAIDLPGDVTTSTEALPLPDHHDHDNHQYYYGDLIAIAASLVYGLDNTLSEYSVKNIDRVEYLGMIGLLGMILSAGASVMFEGDALVELLLSVIDNPLVLLQLAIFALSNACFYIAGSIFLTVSDATLLELSLQTTNVWVLFFSIVTYHIYPSAFFYLSSICMISGVVLYESKNCVRHKNERKETLSFVDMVQRKPLMQDVDDIESVATFDASTDSEDRLVLKKQ
jgi:solute carrier family 35, member F1/2